VAFRIHKELVEPLRELSITDRELTCLRTILFFAAGQSLNTSSVPRRLKHGYCQENVAAFSPSSPPRLAVHWAWFHLVSPGFTVVDENILVILPMLPDKEANTHALLAVLYAQW